MRGSVRLSKVSKVTQNTKVSGSRTRKHVSTHQHALLFLGAVLLSCEVTARKREAAPSMEPSSDLC
jgi:hypothetical protein